LELFLFIRNEDNFAQNIARFCPKSVLCISLKLTDYADAK